MGIVIVSVSIFFKYDKQKYGKLARKKNKTKMPTRVEVRD